MNDVRLTYLLSKFISMWLEAFIIQIVVNWVFANVLFIPTIITYWNGLFIAAFFSSLGYNNVYIINQE